MPSLTVETSGVRRGGVITSRVLIGRLPTNGVVLGDSSVSRLHAWIDCDLDGHYYVADTGSLTGTWVNDKAVDRRQAIQDRDVIRVGKALLTFYEANDLEPDVQPINLAGYPPFEDVDQAGVLFECVCGAPAWFKATAIGHTHKCKQCGRSVIIPDKPGVRAHAIGETVGTPEVVAAHGLAESHADQAASSGEDPHHPYHEHGLSDSFGGQTAVAEADLQTAVHEEHGLAEVEPAAEGGATGFEAEYVSESPKEFPAESPANGNELPPEPEAEYPTLEQMLEAGTEAAAPTTTAEEAPAESDHAGTAHHGEPDHFEYSTAQQAEATAASAEAPGSTEHVAETPADLVAGVMHEPSPPPPSDPQEAVAGTERQSLFASRRRQPAEPLSPPEELPPAPSLAETTASAEAPAAVAEPGPLDAFDHYAAEDSSASVPAPDDEAVGTQTCSVCHSTIAADEATTTCPSCGLTFHAECWNENQGCSAYGCPQVGALAPKDQPEAMEPATEAAAAPFDAAEPDEPFPWEYLYLAASIVGTLLGLLVFGVPSLIAAIGTLIYKIRFPDPARRNGVVTLSILLAILGVGLGVVASVYWWFGGFTGVNWGRLRGK